MKKDSYYEELEKEGYYETVDKRSKDYREYKKWKNNRIPKVDYDAWHSNFDSKSKGLGDTIAKITKATGIEKLVKFIAGEDCGCDERKEILNKKFNYRTVNCITEEDFNYATEFLDRNTNKITDSQQKRMNDIHNSIFGTKKVNSSCVSCVMKTVENIKKYLQVYK